MDISKTSDDECSCTITKEKVVVAEDLILEILFRLPLFSVFRFKFVCKSWYSLISNPDLFFLKHHHHHQQRLLDRHSDDFLLISNSMVDKEVEVDRPWQHNPPEYVLLPQHNQNKNQEQLKVFLDHALSVFIPQKFSSSSQFIDSCNGLLLYRTENNPVSGTGVQTTQYHVFNPITKQCFELPMSNNFRKCSINWLHIVFDPSVSLSFKVLLCCAPHLSSFSSRIYVYSSSETSSSWKYLAKFEGWKYSHVRPVLLDGFLYLYKSPYKLLCYDVVKNKVWFLSLPPRRVESRKKLIFRESWHGCGDLNLLYFGELGGRLRLIRRGSHGHGQDTSAFRFYIMELELKMEVGHDRPKSKIMKWTVKHRVDIKENYEDMAAQIIHIYKTGAAGKKGEEDEEEALLFLNRERNVVISYNLTSNTFGKERKISNFDHYYNLDAFRFTPTLLPFSC